MKYVIYSMVFMLLLWRPVMADDISDVENLLKDKIDAVIVALQNETLDQKNRNEKVIDIVNSVFDFQLMARLGLGEKHWSSLSKEEKKEFTDRFIKRLQDSYVEKLELYTNETVVYDAPQKVKKRIHMTTHLISKDNKVSMLYKLYKSKKEWKIYDIEIQGVSMVQTFRSQFDGVLKTGTFADLLEKLKLTNQLSIDSSEKIKDTTK
jgi:phospholipid transport system substrate-binding protein